MTGWTSADGAQSLARLRQFTNFGLLSVDSPLVDLRLDTWYCLPFDSIGDLELKLEQYRANPALIGSLSAYIAQTRDAFDSFMRLTMCVITCQSSSSSVQLVPFNVPVPASSQRKEIEQSIQSLKIEGLNVSSILLKFDVLITCRDVTGQLGEHWVPGSASIDLVAEANISPETSGEAGGVLWIAHFTCACASIYKQDNRRELHRMREFWRILQEKHPGIEMLPEEVEDYDYIITHAELGDGKEATNADLKSANFPRLKASIDMWERLTSGAFRWLIAHDA